MTDESEGAEARVKLADLAKAMQEVRRMQDRLHAAEARVKELEAERDTYKHTAVECMTQRDEAWEQLAGEMKLLDSSEFQACRAEVRKLREALGPFVCECTSWCRMEGEGPVTGCAHYAARMILSPAPDSGENTGGEND